MNKLACLFYYILYFNCFCSSDFHYGRSIEDYINNDTIFTTRYRNDDSEIARRTSLLECRDTAQWLDKDTITRNYIIPGSTVECEENIISALQSQRIHRAIVVASANGKTTTCHKLHSIYSASKLKYGGKVILCSVVTNSRIAKRQGETALWWRWIVAHYERLPDHVALLHADVGWHVRSKWYEQILLHTPQHRYSLGRLVDGNNPFEDELPCIANILEIVNMTYSKSANDGYCCTESILSRSAIQKFSPKDYESWISLTSNAVTAEKVRRRKQRKIPSASHNSCTKWGYAFERVFAQLFGKGY